MIGTKISNPQEVELGDKVRDNVTLFEGIVVALTLWPHGCIRVRVQPQGVDKDGKVKPIETFDAPQMIILEKRAVPVGYLTWPKEKRTYGPRNDEAAQRR